jgi:DNA-binding transcriptional ArsR family regulator
MSSNNPKRDLYVQFAAVAKAIANEHRLELLELIAQGERSVEVLAGRSGLSIANASQHLQHLRRAGLVKARRQAKFVLYRLADDVVLTMLAAMHRVAERNIGEVERILRSYFHERDELEPVSRAELARRMKQGLVTVLDVRPHDEFSLGHLPGAHNVPLNRLKRQLSKLDRKKRSVALSPLATREGHAVAARSIWACTRYVPQASGQHFPLRIRRPPGRSGKHSAASVGRGPRRGYRDQLAGR